MSVSVEPDFSLKSHQRKKKNSAIANFAEVGDGLANEMEYMVEI